ncbi:MAG: cell envelope biogenesis protein OmpA [Bacteroidota bacterium]
MIQSTIYKVYFIALALFCLGTLNAQQKFNSHLYSEKNKETNKRIGDYLDLVKLGQPNHEIFQDLGNANFLAENYETAAFWYEKLLDMNSNDAFQQRYDFAIDQVQGPNAKDMAERTFLVASIKADYLRGKADFQKNTQPASVTSNDEVPLPKNEFKWHSKEYTPDMSVTQDGSIAYFSKAVYKKPLYGLFSKKELVHEIYRAEKEGGEWKNIQKVIVCPEHFSAKHPTISSDGKKLFFASNMPGTFGEYDIYVTEIKADGSFGIAKNLGSKVNTKTNELYPKLYNGTLLFFASDGRDGYGGLDLYATQIVENTLMASINLGSHINSKRDDFSISLSPEKGLGYVLSNRDEGNRVQKFAIAYGKQTDNGLVAKNEESLEQLLRDGTQIDYSTTVFDE